MPSPSTLFAFAIASAVIIAIPGPSVLFTIGRALSSGRREALLTVVGNALGILTQICALAVGLGPLIAASATAYTALKVVGAGYLVWLGVQAIRNRRALAEAFDAGVPVATPSLHAVRAGYVVGVTNPKTIVFFAALLPQFVVQSSAVFPQLRRARGGVRGARAGHGRHGRARRQPGPRLVRLVAAADGAGRRRRWPDDGRPRHRAAPHRSRRLTGSHRHAVASSRPVRERGARRRATDCCHQAQKPPSTSRSVPVTNDDCAPSRKTTGSATSSTSARRPSGVCAANPALTSGGLSRVIAVRV